MSVITVDQNGNWRDYCASVPEGAEALGVVGDSRTWTRKNCQKGALVRLASGKYVMMRDGQITVHLDGRTIAAALGLSGRPADVAGKRVNVYLDPDSLAIAAKIGSGNVSEGIRAALADAEKSRMKPFSRPQQKAPANPPRPARKPQPEKSIAHVPHSNRLHPPPTNPGRTRSR